jgi:uncharacterized membrane protein HdeD (DUF308 family)
MSSITGELNVSLAPARKEWGWLLALAIALIVLGAAAIIYEFASTIASVVVLGAILIVAGVVQLVAAFQARGLGHVVLYLLLGALELVVGCVLMKHPGAGALSVTLVLSAYFMFSGLFRIISSPLLQFPQFGWSIVSGLITFVLGILLWAEWPISAVWFLGFAVGVNFILLGISWGAVALKRKAV